MHALIGEVLIVDDSLERKDQGRLAPNFDYEKWVSSVGLTASC